jgi:hypothetical protein
MSLKNCIPVARDIVINNQVVTTHLGDNPETKVTFARAIQGMEKPYITINVGAADYDSTVRRENASAAYRIDYITYAESGSEALTIHNSMFSVMRQATDDDFDIRILDEDYFVDVDGVHRATISVVFRTNITTQANA